MNPSSHQRIPIVYTTILFLCGFFLFLEWLYPVEEITETSSLSVFIIYSIFCFFISILQLRWWLSFLINGFGLLFIINGLFFAQPFLSGIWFNQLLMELSFNVNSLFHQQWYGITPLFRSVLFLVLIWLMSYLLHYWFIVMKRIFLFIVLTFIYITVLDTFTIYDADIAIIRTFILSFIALGMANFLKEITSESIHFPWAKKTIMWIAPLITVVLFSSFIGYAAPKFDPQWPDPVPFLKSASDNMGNSDIGSSVQKVGYGEDDSQLGGSFVQDYTPVFQAAAKSEHYWRIETKDVYTGKGWESSGSNLREQKDGVIALETFSEAVETEALTTHLNFSENANIPKVVYPYGIEKVNANQDTQFSLDLATGAIHTKKGNTNVSLRNYSINYNSPSFAIDKLQQTSKQDPNAIKAQYTQLPRNLPERIGDLAREITVSLDSRYDKARAVEQYFGQSGFEYQIEDIPVPEENEDYVGQFLFDSQIGYCDNYSTSMVVMLRTLDIPARWAKGFTSGEKIESDVGEGTDIYDIYEVTNANAHSWVEVYFPETGWVPFEPTQGFSNLNDFHLNSADGQGDDGSETTPELEEQLEQEEEKSDKEDEQGTETGNTNGADTLDLNWKLIIYGSIGFVLLAMMLYLIRFRIKTFIVSLVFNKKQDAKSFQDAYHHLLNLLNHKGLKKTPDQTLREYAKRVDERYHTSEMSMLTSHYERMLYNNEIDHTDTEVLHQFWKSLIKRIMA